MGTIKHSNNLKSGVAYISDLELLLIVCEKLVENKIEEHKKGIILNKGTDKIKVSYKKVEKTLEELNTYFGYKGTFSIGVCESCTKFKTNSSGGMFGECRLAKKTVNIFDTCNEHSKKGAGYGRSK
jgi:hypothetical protein